MSVEINGKEFEFCGVAEVDSRLEQASARALSAEQQPSYGVLEYAVASSATFFFTPLSTKLHCHLMSLKLQEQ